MLEIITVKQLTKKYGDKEVVKGINFSVYQGEILCILGPNGAGKSTTIQMLSGVLKSDQGEILSNKKSIYQNLSHYQKDLGIVPQDLALYEDLTAMQNVEFFASLYGLKGQELKDRCDYALTFVGLKNKANDKVNTFSGGMKRRLNIACAIAHQPKVLIMDEPTVGIDPQSRNHILSAIKKLSKEGMTIIYTTHYMEEVEEISDRIMIMDHGSIIATGTKEEIKAGTESEKIIYIDGENIDTIDSEVFYTIEGVTQVRQETSLEITSVKSIENLDYIIGLCIKQGIKIRNIKTQEKSLETVFLDLTGRSLRD